MDTIFGVQWDKLSLRDVEAFLTGADLEPLSWEAKGNRLDEHHVRKTVCAFANSHDGGYLVLGAEETQGGGFALTGLPFPEEPHLWISTVVRDGVRPWPAIDVRPFAVNDERHVAVVWTPPIATPPCISRGTVYERIPGASPVVRDPARLAELYGRGDAAHSGARNRATRAAEWMLDDLDTPTDSEDSVGFALGVTATGFTNLDIAAKLFCEPFESKLCEAVNDLPSNEPPMITSQLDLLDWAQDSITVGRKSTYHLGSNWKLRASWDGAIAVCWTLPVRETTADSLVDEPLTAAWSAAISLLELLGGASSQHLVIHLIGHYFVSSADISQAHRRSSLPIIGRGPLPIGVDPLQLFSIEREIRRVLGQQSYET
jgi:hypothetical protein